MGCLPSYPLRDTSTSGADTSLLQGACPDLVVLAAAAGQAGHQAWLMFTPRSYTVLVREGRA